MQEISYNEFNNLDKMDKLFQLTNGQIEYLNSPSSIRKIESVIINLPTNKTVRKVGFTDKFYQNLRKK